MQVGEHACHEDIHSSQQVLLRNHLVKVELDRIAAPDPGPVVPSSPESPADLDQQELVFEASVEPFFDSIGHSRRSDG